MMSWSRAGPLQPRVRPPRTTAASPRIFQWVRIDLPKKGVERFRAAYVGRNANEDHDKGSRAPTSSCSPRIETSRPHVQSIPLGYRTVDGLRTTRRRSLTRGSRVGAGHARVQERGRRSTSEGASRGLRAGSRKVPYDSLGSAPGGLTPALTGAECSAFLDRTLVAISPQNPPRTL